MRRFVSIWLPEFTLERLTRAEPGAVPRTAPFALAAAEGNRLIVNAANHAAIAVGVRPGMGLADARAIAPMLASRPAEPARDTAALARLARRLVRYGPAFNTDGADGLWVDVTGTTHLYAGEVELLSDLSRRLARAGFTAKLGLADGLGAAWALARYSAPGGRLSGGVEPGARKYFQIAPPGQSRDLLADLPVEALRIDMDAAQLLRRLGLKRTGQLYALPRAALERRFRVRVDAVLARLDQALGLKPEPLRPMRVPPEYVTYAAFPEPLISGDGLEAALAALAHELSASLAAAKRGARRLLLTLHRSDSTRAAIRAGLSRPSRSVPHMLALFREKLSAIDAGYGIDLMQLTAATTEPLNATQGRLTGGTETGDTDDEALAALIDRLAGRLGPTRVLRLEPRASHLPERAEVLESLLAPGGRLPGEESPGASKSSPPLLLPIPELITVVSALPEGPPQLLRWRRTLRRIVRAEGPERIAPEWWRETGAAASATRDYYVIEDETGARFWVFRDGQHGEAEAAGNSPSWYLHGVFG